jgi:hypothetical protein
MSITALDAENALSSGAKLWILADLGHSRWTERIDWYLNFQINRAEPHTTPQIGEKLNAVLAETEFVAPEVKLLEKAPLMVSSSELLPNHVTVVVPLADSASEWVLRGYAVWTELGRPELRVFLPESVSLSTFQSAWPREGEASAVQVVSPRESSSH